MDRDAELRPAELHPVSRPARLPAPGRALLRLGAGSRARPRLAVAATLAFALCCALALPTGPAAAQAGGSRIGEPQTGAPARTGATCGARAEVVSHLEAKYGETRRGYGLQRGRAVVEVYASARTGSWTIIVSMPDGRACLVAAGENWATPVAEAAEAVGDPA